MALDRVLNNPARDPDEDEHPSALSKSRKTLSLRGTATSAGSGVLPTSATELETPLVSHGRVVSRSEAAASPPPFAFLAHTILSIQIRPCSCSERLPAYHIASRNHSK